MNDFRSKKSSLPLLAPGFWLLASFHLSCFVICVSCFQACAPTDADRKSLDNGFSQYSSRNFDQAQSAADAYIKKFPDADNIAEAYYLRGLTHLSRGNTADKPLAAQDLQTAIAKTQRTDLIAKAHRALGDLDFDAQNFPQALDHYQKSIDANPAAKSDPYLHYRIGSCLQALGQWDKARPFFDRVISLNTDPALTQRSISRSGAKNFSLQFGAFREQPKAADLVKQLKAQSIQATVATEMRDNQLLYLVRSGSYNNYDQATTARNQLVAKHPSVTIVP